ncbi:hypothetical protein ACWGQ5_47200 [Streptomyces sp. NPDC055722]
MKQAEQHVAVVVCADDQPEPLRRGTLLLLLPRRRPRLRLRLRNL